MKKSKIYTKTGDKGQTGLVSGNRTSKSDPRIGLYGEVDELNSRLGFTVAQLRVLKSHENEIQFLEKIQSQLFDLGSNLACEVARREEWKLPQLSSEGVLAIEDQIDIMDADLEPLKNFILPGGHPVAASIHLCRTCCRSVERQMIAYHQQTLEPLPNHGVEFINRLSDYLFVLARWMNKKLGVSETLWMAKSSN